MSTLQADQIGGLLRLPAESDAINVEPLRSLIAEGKYQRIFLELDASDKCKLMFELCHEIARMLAAADVRLFGPIVVSLSLLPDDEQRELFEWFGNRGIDVTLDSFEAYAKDF
jgi:hypothetical protein